MFFFCVFIKVMVLLVVVIIVKPVAINNKIVYIVPAQ